MSEQQNQGRPGRLAGRRLGGAAAGTAVMLGGGTVAALVRPVGADVLRVRIGPTVGTDSGVVGAAGGPGRDRLCPSGSATFREAVEPVTPESTLMPSVSVRAFPESEKSLVAKSME